MREYTIPDVVADLPVIPIPRLPLDRREDAGSGVRTRARHLAFRTEATLLELALGLIALSIGLWLLLPFDTYGDGQVWRIVRAWLPEWVLGLLLAMSGCAQLWYGWSNHAARHQRARCLTSAAHAGLYAVLSFNTFVADPSRIHAPNLAVLSCCEVLIAMRAGGAVDRRGRGGVAR